MVSVPSELGGKAQLICVAPRAAQTAKGLVALFSPEEPQDESEG